LLELREQVFDGVADLVRMAIEGGWPGVGTRCTGLPWASPTRCTL